ncbi:hypothetical protein HDV63DRAFT_411075 [Trichoderma sp. SZMC 28014]
MPSRVLSGRIQKKGKTSPRPHQRSALLNLPIDLIREISDHLSPADSIIFATTCRAVRNCSGRGQFPPADTDEAQEQRFEYLASMCRDMPDHWVCEQCMRCHRIDTDDTPTDSRPTCPLAEPYGRYNQPLPLVADDYELGRRHVQLALKYTRMGDSLTMSHRQYLQRLIAARQFSLAFPWRKKATITAKIAPRIVAGRFLLHTICEYRVPSQMSRGLIASQSVCQHQQFFPYEDGAWTNTNRSLYQDLRQFPRAVDESFESPGKEVRGHCPHCFTDFSVTTTARSARISVWMDLGTESSPLDPVWRSFVYNAEFPPIEEVEHIEPGRVRELYGSGEEEEE